MAYIPHDADAILEIRDAVGIPFSFPSVKIRAIYTIFSHISQGLTPIFEIVH